ncbi:hypothetical protein KC331_g7245 [Hortaea werneckii]|uniref:Uncharacterized protein n=1 Tax=Hortaea werneckii TaxID=91943 RepID=A0A3M7D9K7_HORWE|nr:hypothetical protein KC331_g7245 [Hortaea werneckii]KAI7704003.1 hypothetical protein KC353_g13762 [Hortaea werneckii]RMY60972.1 hypothetical protein D0865_01237 [Hortaea werneckii]
MIGNMIGMFGIYLTGLLAAGAAAQSTLQLFIDNLDPNTHWAASVIENCNGTTTYAAVCTSAAFNDACSADAQPITITEGPSVFKATTEAIYSETSATITESCDLHTAESSAQCYQTIAESNYGRDNLKTISFNLTGTAYYEYDVEATAGVNKLGDEGSCSTSGAGSTVGMFGLGAMALGTLGLAIVL